MPTTRAVLVVAAALAAAACGRSVEDKIHGWPPPAAAFRDTVEPPDTWEPPDTLPPEPEDTAPVDPDALPSEPCAAVVELACRYYGPYSDECHEAQTRAPDGRDPETAAACAALVERYAAGGEEAESRVNPCRRYARLMCKELGRETQACQRASAVVARLVYAREKRACLGDLLMFEARTLPHR
ncbi:MAG: hypothetical protein CVU56_21730 [Deltaproteobacteria bacterium HGW-Deltaproteobacteria-14]|jgi:hypothetical protein|nr:MAG: hypothetical protein CVU56_21730 [Deltaproteobacteria bacterium HGW-Deltaproteobacteria-14]